MPTYLKLEDLNAVASPTTVLGLFDDAASGTVTETQPSVLLTIDRAEAEAASVLLRNFSEEAILEMGTLDLAFRSHVAWVAMHFASERRGEFVEEDGNGRYKAQYDRAMKYFNSLAKSANRSTVANAGLGANSGGKLNPQLSAPRAARFTFAPDKDNPKGSGGF